MTSRTEGFFFRNSRAALCELLQIKDLTEIDRVDTITLPDAVGDPMRQAVAETLRDPEARERDLSFQYQDGRTVLTNKLVGSELNLTALTSNKTLGTSTQYSLAELLHETVKIYFGQPKFIAAHTHPALTLDFLQRHGIPASSLYTHKEQGIALDMPALVALFSDHALYPSDGDIANLVSNVRYWRNQLIGSQQGLVLIINPSFHMPVRAKALGIREYNAAAQVAVVQYMKSLAQHNPHKEDFHQAKQQALCRFANQNGLLVFMGDDFRHNSLKRLR